MKDSQIAAGENPRRLIWRRPVAKLQRKLIGATAKQESIDGRFQLGCTVIFSRSVEAREPVDAPIGGGNVTIQAASDVIDDFGHRALFT
jgi:hypothetical protein